MRIPVPAADPELPASIRRALAAALEALPVSADRRTWQLREGLDTAYATLAMRRMTTSTSH